MYPCAQWLSPIDVALKYENYSCSLTSICSPKFPNLWGGEFLAAIMQSASAAAPHWRLSLMSTAHSDAAAIRLIVSRMYYVNYLSNLSYWFLAYGHFSTFCRTDGRQMREILKFARFDPRTSKKARLQVRSTLKRQTSYFVPGWDRGSGVVDLGSKCVS